MSILNFQKFINEGSYTHSDIPKKFYVSINLQVGYDAQGVMDLSKPSTFQDLANGVLAGVKGIAGTRDNIFDWFSSRTLMLVMNAQDVLRLNKLSMINYHNANYLLSKDMKHLKRVMNYEHEDTEGMVLLFLNILGEYIVKNQESVPASYNKVYNTIMEQEEDELLDFHVDPINHIGQLGTVVMRMFEKFGVDMSDGEWAKLCEDAIEYYMGYYKFEKEWLVKNNTLHVPVGSQLVFKTNSYGVRTFTEESMEKGIAAFNLRDKYRISFVDKHVINDYEKKMRKRRRGVN